jgi:hypothetical protein
MDNNGKKIGAEERAREGKKSAWLQTHNRPVVLRGI